MVNYSGQLKTEAFAKGSRCKLLVIMQMIWDCNEVTGLHEDIVTFEGGGNNLPLIWPFIDTLD